MPGFENYEAYKYNMYANAQGYEDSRWATDFEMKKCLKEIIIKSDQYDSGGLPLLSNGRIAYVDDSDAHSLILGATGSKKSRLLCMPLLNILAKAGESIIATDPKGELYEQTSGLLKQNGYNLIVLNFRDPSCGDAWNPLTIPYQFYQTGEKDKAAEAVNDFLNCIIAKNEANDPFWEETPRNFCFGLLWLLLECAKKEEVNVRSLTFLRAYAESELLYKIYSNLNPQTLAAINLGGTLNSGDKTKPSILACVDQYIRIFSAQQSLSEMLSYSSFDIDRIGMEKTAVFIIMPDEKNTYHFLVSVFIKQCYESLIRIAQAQPKHKLPIRTNFVLDEFANIPAIPDMPSMITAARSRNIRFNLVVQSEHQLQRRYKEEAQTIKGNCSNWVFLTSRELPLLDEISKLCGVKKSRSNGVENTIPLISVSQLQRLSKERGEALVFHGRQYPYITTLADIEQYEFGQLTGIPIRRRGKKQVSLFDITKFETCYSEEEVNGLFKDEVIEWPSGEDEEETTAMTEEEISKRFDKLFKIT